MKNITIFLLNITWGILQSFIGLVGFMCFLRRPHYWYKGSIVTIVQGNWGGISLGAFIFIDTEITKEDASASTFVNHEAGHAIQSTILGPLYLLIIGLPSMIWAQFFDGYRKRKSVSYYSFYTESWADELCGVVMSRPSGYRFVKDDRKEGS